MLERLVAQHSDKTERPANVGEFKMILQQSEANGLDPHAQSKVVEDRDSGVIFPHDTHVAKRGASMPIILCKGKFARYLIPQLRNALAEQLPDYMMPSSFVLLDEWPLTPGGKIDLHALPEA